MIQSDELLIGSYVAWSDGQIDVINQIGKDGKSVGLKSDIPTDLLSPIKILNPIPLTPQWLEDFGFEYNEASNIWIHKSYDMTLSKNKGGYDLLEVEYGNTRPNPNYVHELQGLFKFLTGEMLTKKL